MIVSLGKSMRLETYDGDINDLTMDDSEKLTSVEFLQIPEQQHLDAVEDVGSNEENSVTENDISTGDIKVALAK